MNLAIINIGLQKEYRDIDGFDMAFLVYKKFNLWLGADFTKINKGKFKNIYMFFAEHPKAATEYDYYWFPNPDLEFINIDGMMDFVTKNKLDLCQPALTGDSMFYHKHTVKQGQGIRRVPFVEGMCPIFSRKALQKNLWTFDLNWSSYGIDILWGRDNECFVLDDFTVKHPFGPTYLDHAKAAGFPDPRQEMKELCNKFGLAF